MKSRTTPTWITDLKSNEVFVFGSNLGGFHGAGAARLAKENWGAKMGVGFGPTGQTFAIPSKDEHIQTMSVKAISPYVKSFIDHAESHPNQTFLVTEIGCGLAGHDVEDIAPLFRDAVTINNIHLPERFWRVLKKDQ